jgi:hypothetical protein
MVYVLLVLVRFCLVVEEEVVVVLAGGEAVLVAGGSSWTGVEVGCGSGILCVYYVVSSFVSLGVRFRARADGLVTLPTSKKPKTLKPPEPPATFICGDRSKSSGEIPNGYFGFRCVGELKSYSQHCWLLLVT